MFVPALLLSILTPLFLPSSSVSYFVLAVTIRECLGKLLHHEFPMSNSHTEWYLDFIARQNSLLLGPKLRLSKSNHTKLTHKSTILKTPNVNTVGHIGFGYVCSDKIQITQAHAGGVRFEQRRCDDTLLFCLVYP